MSRRFATDIDLLSFKLLHAMIDPVTSDPSLSLGDAGRVWCRTDTTPPSLRFWTGTTVIDLKDRSSDTGSQLSTTISDFVTAVQAIKWSTMAVPTTSVPMNTQNFSALAAASGSGQAVEYAQFQTALAGVQSGLDFKTPPAQVVVTTNMSLTAPGSTINGHTMVANDTVLLTGQTTASQNGIYLWNSSTSLSRRTDSNTTGAIFSGTMISVGSTDSTSPDTVWMQTTAGTGTNGAITIGTDSLTWIKPFTPTAYSGSSTINVSGVGGTISAILQSSNSGLLSSSGLAIDTSIVTRKAGGVVPMSTGGIFTVSGATLTVNHNLGSSCPLVVVRAYTSPSPYVQGQLLECDNTATDANNVSVVLPSTPGSNQYIVDIYA